MVELVNEVGVTLIGTNASDDMVAMAAWVSHDADSEARLEDKDRVEKLIRFLYKNRHMSPFEHGQFIFKVDVPLFVAREFHRHRTMSYNEVSGRYTEMKPRFWEGTVARVQHGKPGDYYFLDGSDEQTALYRSSKSRAAKAAWKEYTDRLASGIAKEQAREDLPLSLMTQFYATVNPRNLMQFLDLRNDKHALREIRDVAVKMEAIFAETMPMTYKAYVTERQRRRSALDYEDMYKGLDVEYKALQERYNLLLRDAQSVENARNAMEAALKQRDEFKKQFEEMNKEYNGLVTTNHKLVAENQKLRDGWDVKLNDIETIPDDGRVETGKSGENITYNIYVNSADAESVGKKVIETLHARKRRT